MNLKRKFTHILPFIALFAAPCMAQAANPAYWAWAQTPPMGWNSWDGFATTVTEAQTRAQADFMAQTLRQHGWQYIVVDIQWYSFQIAILSQLLSQFDRPRNSPLLCVMNP